VAREGARGVIHNTLCHLGCHWRSSNLRIVGFGRHFGQEKVVAVRSLLFRVLGLHTVPIVIRPVAHDVGLSEWLTDCSRRAVLLDALRTELQVGCNGRDAHQDRVNKRPLATPG
jgi:hypothetical protein